MAFFHSDLDEEVYMQVLQGLDVPNSKMHVKAELHEAFKIKDIGSLKFFLGLEIARCSTGLTIHQRKYILDLLEECGMINCKPTSTPMDYSTKLTKISTPIYGDIPFYRRLIGRLVYLTTTRLDISFAVGKLSHCLDYPTIVHYQAVICGLKYLKQSLATDLFFDVASDLMPSRLSNVDWTSCSNTMHSISRYCFYLGTSLISWKSKEQPIVPRSSSEAEYRALALSTCGGSMAFFHPH
nr:uncharacterized protein LOC112748125 [Arachis hypogaea]